MNKFHRFLSMVTLLFAVSPVKAEPNHPDVQSARALALKIVESHGGPDKLLRTVKFTETYHLNGKLDKGTDRTSFIQPPLLWYVGKKERVSQENKGGVCHDVWMWTLGPLVDSKGKLDLLPDTTVEGKSAKGLSVSGCIEPPMHAYFDAVSDDLLKIEWKGEQFIFSDPIDVDGTRVPSKCILIGKKGQERMRTTLRDIQRLAELPADLPKPASAAK
jgi:hypothetical protein